MPPQPSRWEVCLVRMTPPEVMVVAIPYVLGFVPTESWWSYRWVAVGR